MPISEAIKSTQWLQANLGAETLRIYDCTARLEPDPEKVFRVLSGRNEWEREHIPGAVHIDLERDISDPGSGLRFTMPKRAVFAEAMGRMGVGNDSLVVLYSAGHYMWATRVLWMLRDIGFENAFVLDGGLARWRAEGRPLTSGEQGYEPARLDLQPAHAHFVGKDAVISSIAHGDAVLVNALPPGQFRGDPGETNHGRPGRIVSSVNIPANSLLDARDGTLLPGNLLDEVIAAAGISPAQRVICYCGGGVSATCVATVLVGRGFRDVTVYDGSLNEWAADPTLPMEAG